MPKVYNKRQSGVPASAVYVGRPSVFGNPFVIGRDGTREDVIAQYEAWLLGQPRLMRLLPALKGRDLVCWCAPEACHADVLIHHANKEA